LIAQETLRDMPLGRVDIDAKLENARKLDPDVPDLAAADRDALTVLYLERRELLTKIANTASARITDTTELETQQSELLSVYRSKLVGRVNEDNYWHSPAVILGCLIVALPLPLFFQFLATLFVSSSNPDPFIASLAETFAYLAAFILLFLTWRAWDRDKSLFDAHYKLPKALRLAVNRNLRWFIPTAAISTAIIFLSGDSPAVDVYEGLSLFAFIITSLVLSLFAYRVLWTERKALSATFGKESTFEKYRMPITLFTAGLPLITALLASLGYYDTAREFLTRLFYSGWLLLLTYVVYGLIRRTVVVAQRRLALRQAIEKRDAAVKARKDKIEQASCG